MLSFRRFSQPRDQTCISYVSSLAGGFFTTSTTWKGPRHMDISGFGDPRGIHRNIPQRKLKNDFKISKKT